jgi:flagellar protein FlaJ
MRSRSASTRRTGPADAGETAPDDAGEADWWSPLRTPFSDTASSLSLLDRLAHALFARHADHARHERDRQRYRGTDLRTGFDVFVARLYGVAWAVGVLIGLVVATAAVLVRPALFDSASAAVVSVVPLVDQGTLPTVSPSTVAVGGGVLAGAVGRRGTVAFGSQYLRWRATARKANIERTLPGAVRYLHVLSTGSAGRREMLRRVAAVDAYGETAVAVRKVLNTATLTGNLGEGLRRVARDTPSRDFLAPFLLKFREHGDQGPDALSNYLQMESRMLGYRQDRARKRATGFLELLSELFIVLLVLPTLLVIVLTVLSVIAPGLGEPVVTPAGTTTVRGLMVYASIAFILGVGVFASGLVGTLRPPDQVVRYERPRGAIATVRSAPVNPASAGVVALGPAALVVGLALAGGYRPTETALAGYVAYGVPVGLVALRRARIDGAKDRQMADFVHAVSGHVNLGRPFPDAVELVARDVELGPLDADVADLAKNLSFTTPHVGSDAIDVRTAALDRFVDRVGTPLAEQTIGLVTGALETGSDAGTVFETLQSEIGRLYHEKRSLRSAMLVYVAVGWTTALLVVGITVAVSTHVYDGFAQLTALSASDAGLVNTGAVDLPRDRRRIYQVTQATMLAAGWFAGSASRGRYEALLHSGLLVAVCHVVFAAVGL